ncbi:MAG: carboxypeptidase regulatory-like domain-containing protein [Acidobacteria bacterium]|nr:carboxypeptidase regulatory-like domain-containing protein [Acidobacteriota bacterium]
MRRLVFAFTAGAALAQTGAVEGHVSDALTKAPVAGAVVKLYQGERVVQSGVSDVRGAFRWDGLTEGAYRLTVQSADHLPLAPDQAAARTLYVSAVSPEIRLRADLTPLGSVTGRALSPAGEPMKGVPIGMRRLWDGHWIRTTVSGEGGLFEFTRLEPGTWLLAGLPSFRISSRDPANDVKPLATPEGEAGQRMGWAATFFPGIVDLAGAEKIVVRPGAALEGYDIKLRTVPVHRVAGVVVDAEGKPAAKAMLSLSDLNNKGANGGLTTSDGEGRFAFDTAMDGEWRVFGQVRQEEKTLKGYADVHVSKRDVEGVELRLMAPFAVTGVVEREEPRDEKGSRKVTAVYLIPQGATDDVQESAFHQQDGKFTLSTVYAGRYRVLPAGYVPGYYVASIWYGDQEVTTRAVDVASPPLPLRIVYRQGAARATGSVERGEGTWVVFVPQDEALRDPHQFIRSAKCEANGRFSIEHLRPGSYYAFAFNRVQREMLEDVEFVRRIVPHAERVDMRHGETVNLELRPQAWPDY